MFRIVAISFIACFASLFAESQANVEIESMATLTGTIEIKSPPPNRRISQQYAGTSLEELGEPAPPLAVIYLIPKNPDLVNPTPREKLPVKQMEQRGLWFFPSVLAVEKGTTVEFPNLDNTYHNVFSYSPTKRFDLGRYRRGEGPPFEVFDQPGEVNIFCEVHEHMRATILVLETPLHTTSDEKGIFEITDIPPGDYIVHVWLSRRNHWKVDLKIHPGTQVFPHTKKP